MKVEITNDNDVWCANCGLRLHIWGRKDGTTYWKHSAGWRSGRKACRKATPRKTGESS